MKYVLAISTSGSKNFYQPFTLKLSIVLTPFVGLPHTHGRHVQHVHSTSKAYAHTNTAATELQTANKQNKTSKPNIKGCNCRDANVGLQWNIASTVFIKSAPIYYKHIFTGNFYIIQIQAHLQIHKNYTCIELIEYCYILLA